MTILEASDVKPLRRSILFSPSLHRIISAGRNINRLSIGCSFCHCLRAAQTVVDCHCYGNLGFSGSRFLTNFVVTHASILSSIYSTAPRGCGFNAYGMLSYSEHINVLSRIFGSLLSPDEFSAQPANRIVSCYTLFKGWLPLSQPPICLWRITALNT